MTGGPPGQAENTGRTGRSPLNPDVILAAAIGLIDLDGVGQLTMRRLGASLGVEAMAIYRYFPSRNALIDGIVQRVVGDAASDPAAQLHPGDDWRDYLDRIAHGVRRMALAHPRVFPLVATQPTEAPWIRPPLRSLPWVDTFLAGLQDHHFPPPAAVEVYKHFCTFLLGHLLLEVAALGLEHPDTASAPPAAPDVDARVADTVRATDAAHAEAVTVTDEVNADEIVDAATGRTATLADQPTVQAMDPTAAITADNAEQDHVDAVAIDAEIPVAAAVVSTEEVPIDSYPHIQALAGLLSRDTSARDFDRHLGWVLDNLNSLRRP